MGVPGPKPKPREQRIREGNPGNHPLPEPVRLNDASELEAPEDFDPVARECWDDLVPILLKFGIVDGVDQVALEALCLQYARAVEARKVIAKEGIFAEGYSGQPVVHPAVKIEREAQAMYLRFAEQYALTPVARTRLGKTVLQSETLQKDLAVEKPTLTKVANGNGHG